MLLLTRKLGENIRIGDDITITVVEVKGSHVKLGIDAPPEVTVHREEIYKRIQREKSKPGSPEPVSPGNPTTGPSGEDRTDDRT